MSAQKVTPLQNFLRQATSTSIFTHSNMDSGKYYISDDYEETFLDLWERAVKKGETYPITKLLKGNKYDGKCTCVLDIDNYPDIEIYKNLKIDFVIMCKQYFNINKKSDVSLFEHTNTHHETKIHLYLLVDGSPITVKFGILKMIRKTLKDKFNPEGKEWLDVNFTSLRIPGACKKGCNPNDGVYPLVDEPCWRGLLFYSSFNKFVEVNGEEWLKYWKMIYDKKTDPQKSETEKSKIVLNTQQIEEIYSEDTQKFILDNINILTVDFNIMLSLYNLFMNYWNRDFQEFKDIVASRKQCSGECAEKFHNQVQLNPKKYKLSIQESFFRLRKKIIQMDGDMKLCPVFNVKVYNCGDLYISQSFAISCMMNGDIGLSELYSKLTYKHFIPTNPQVDGKGVVGYIWSQPSKLWIALTFKMLQHNISISLYQIIGQHVRYLEKELEAQTDKSEIKKFQNIINATKKVLTQVKDAKGVSGIACYSLTSSTLIDKNFTSRLNMTKYVIPLKGTKCIDLREKTLHIRERTKEDYFTETFDVSEIGDPENPTFQKYIQMFQQKPEIRQLLQTTIGEALLGIYGKRCHFTYLLGPQGSNGKTVFFNLLKKMMSTNFCISLSDPDLISIDKKHSKKDSRRDFARIAGKRIAYFYELDCNKVLDSRMIKCVCGGETIDDALLFKNTSSHEPTYKFFICSNNFPEFTECDRATLDRTIIIPCYTIFGEGGDFPKDQELITDIEENHLQDFFAWALQGALNFMNNDEEHIIPKEVRKLQEKNTTALDPFSEFITTCVFGKDQRIKKSVFHKKYRNFLDDNGYEDVKFTPQKFSQSLFKVHPEIKIKKVGEFYYMGVDTNYDTPQEEELETE